MGIEVADLRHRRQRVSSRYPRDCLHRTRWELAVHPQVISARPAAPGRLARPHRLNIHRPRQVLLDADPAHCPPAGIQLLRGAGELMKEQIMLTARGRSPGDSAPAVRARAG